MDIIRKHIDTWIGHFLLQNCNQPLDFSETNHLTKLKKKITACDNFALSNYCAQVVYDWIVFFSANKTKEINLLTKRMLNKMLLILIKVQKPTSTMTNKNKTILINSQKKIEQNRNTNLLQIIGNLAQTLSVFLKRFNWSSAGPRDIIAINYSLLSKFKWIEKIMMKKRHQLINTYTQSTIVFLKKTKKYPSNCRCVSKKSFCTTQKLHQ